MVGDIYIIFANPPQHSGDVKSEHLAKYPVVFFRIVNYNEKLIANLKGYVRNGGTRSSMPPSAMACWLIRNFWV